VCPVSGPRHHHRFSPVASAAAPPASTASHGYKRSVPPRGVFPFFFPLPRHHTASAPLPTTALLAICSDRLRPRRHLYKLPQPPLRLSDRSNCTSDLHSGLLSFFPRRRSTPPQTIPSGELSPLRRPKSGLPPYWLALRPLLATPRRQQPSGFGRLPPPGEVWCPPLLQLLGRKAKWARKS
jgi:hypothetical protein